MSAAALFWKSVLTLLPVLLPSVNAMLLPWEKAKDRKVEVVYAKADAPTVPAAPEDYPESLKGTLWMDQGGVISESKVSESSVSPDAGLTFGDSTNKLDTEKKEMFVDTLGPAWQWLNNVAGYSEFVKIEGGGLPHGDPAYRFVFNDDYTFAQIYLAYWGWEIPKQILSFTMSRQTPPEGVTCPPKADASKKEFSQCATWVRESYLYGFFSLGKYYAFQVTDADGSPVQPYYDKFIEHVKSKSKPDCDTATKDGFVGDECEGADVFTGKAGTKPSRLSTRTWWIVTLALLTAGIYLFCLVIWWIYLACTGECKCRSSESPSMKQSLLA